MIELAKHIEALLVDNDCVIVPGVGGFIIHYAPAIWTETNRLFLPPTRMTGFNSRLKVNDGLLVQSYMTAHHIGFFKASKQVEKDVDELWSVLHTEGKVLLENIGLLRLSVHGTLEFIPCTTSLCTPSLYGWSSFGMRKLDAKVVPARMPSTTLAPAERGKRPLKTKINAPLWSNAAAVVAIIILCFALSIPVENTEVMKGNYAQLLPTEAFRQMGGQSLTITPLAIKEIETPQAEPKKTEIKETESPAPEVSEVKVEVPKTKVEASKAEAEAPKAKPKKRKASESPKPAANVSSPRIYHIIVASVGTSQDAQNMALTLTNKGFKNAKAIIGGGKMRVCIDSYASEAEAYRALNRYRENETFKNAWVLKKK